MCRKRNEKPPCVPVYRPGGMWVQVRVILLQSNGRGRWHRKWLDRGEWSYACLVSFCRPPPLPPVSSPDKKVRCFWGLLPSLKLWVYSEEPEISVLCSVLSAICPPYPRAPTIISTSQSSVCLPCPAIPSCGNSALPLVPPLLTDLVLPQVSPPLGSVSVTS